MPYVERVTKAGNTIEIERYFTSRYKKKGIPRVTHPAYFQEILIMSTSRNIQPV